MSDEDPIRNNQETDKLEGKMFRLRREAIRAFDILKAEQGPRSGPRLMTEAIDLLLILYGKSPIEEEHHGWIAARQQQPAAPTTAGSMRPGFVPVPISKPKPAKKTS